MEIANPFIAKYFSEHNLQLLGKDEAKRWGGYYIFEVAPDHDKKVLWVKPGELLSLQYHGSQEHPGHRELFVPLTKMRVILGTKSVVGLSPEDFETELRHLRVLEVYEEEPVKIESGVLHAYTNPFDTDVYLLETRTSIVPEDSDTREANITRVYDQTQRNGTPQYPQGLIDQVFAKS